MTIINTTDSAASNKDPIEIDPHFYAQTVKIRMALTVPYDRPQFLFLCIVTNVPSVPHTSLQHTWQ